MNLFSDLRPLFGQDPFLINWGGKDFLVQSQDDRTIILKSINYDLAYQILAKSSEQEIWAPELHEIDGQWYIYYAASDGENRNHRTMVAGPSKSPIGLFLNTQRIGENIWGIDMTVLSWKGKRYAVWSGWENNGDEFPQNLYIADMTSPTTIGERRLLASPYLDWQKSIAAIIEGPQAFEDRGKLYLLYSANASWTVEYATGVMELIGTNPLNPCHWLECPWPLMKNAGHGQMTDDIFIYHRKMSGIHGWADREIVTIPRGTLLEGKPFRRFKGDV